MSLNWENLNKEERAKAVRFYLIDKRWSYDQLANYLNVSRNVIAGICNRHDISIVRDRPKAAAPIPPTAPGVDNVVLFPLLHRPSPSREEAVVDMVKKSVAKLKAKRIAGVATSAAHKFHDRQADLDSVIERKPEQLRSEVWQPLPGSMPILFEDANSRHCQWPVSDDNKMCCGNHVKEGKVYCATHCTIAYRPAPVMKFKKRKAYA